jgi:mRNA interferase RelE/StbE
MKTIVFTRQAAKELDALPEDAQTAVMEGLASYATAGIGDVKKMTGREGYRLRIGDYRVVFDQDQTTILAVYVGRRSTTTYRRN